MMSKNWCSSVRFMVMQDTVRPSEKENISRQNKKMEGTNGPDPLSSAGRVTDGGTHWGPHAELGKKLGGCG
jgi:hypothetical protein